MDDNNPDFISEGSKDAAPFTHDTTKEGGIAHFVNGGEPQASPQAPIDTSQNPDFIPDGQFPTTQTTPVDTSQNPDFIPDDQMPKSDGETYGSGLQTLGAFGEGLGRGALSSPLFTALELGSGLTTGEAIRKREEQSPFVSKAGEGLGLAGSMAVPWGQGALLGRAAEGVAGAVGLGAKALDAASLSTKVGATALKAATEFGLLQSGDEITNKIIQDPNTSSQLSMIDNPITNILKASATGAALGGAFGLASPLLMKGAPAAAKMFEEIKGTLGFRGATDKVAEKMTDELTSLHNTATDIARGKYGENGTRDQAIKDGLSDMHQGMSDTVQDLIDKGQAILDKNKGNPAYNDFETEFNNYKKKVLAPVTSDADTFLAQNKALSEGVPFEKGPGYATIADPNALFSESNGFKKYLGEESGFNKDPRSVSQGDKSYFNSMKGLGSSFKEALEDSDVWGKAGDIQTKVNAAIHDYIGPAKLADTSLMKKTIDPATGNIIKQPDLDKVQTLITQIEKGKKSTDVSNLNTWKDSVHNLIDAVDKAHGLPEGTSLFDPHVTPVTNRYLGPYTQGMKIGDAMARLGIKSFSDLPAAGIGMHIGSVAGPEGVLAGSYMGKALLGPFFENLIRTVGLPLFEKIANAPGLRGASKYIDAVKNGDEILSKGAQNIFKSGAQIIPLSLIPKKHQIEQLNRQLVATQDNPSGFANNLSNNPLGHYMPNQSAAVSQTTASAVQYLNSIRPDKPQNLPLDAKRTPSSTDVAKYQNALTIAHQPMMALQKIKEGTFTSEDLKHLNAMYPAFYNEARLKLAQSMTDHLSKGNTIPYQTRLPLSVFLGQPLDSTMTQQSIMAAQPQSAQAPGPGQQAPPQGGGKSTKALSKVSSQYLTDSQARQRREGDRGK